MKKGNAVKKKVDKFFELEQQIDQGNCCNKKKL
jgi:hypothetical protein